MPKKRHCAEQIIHKLREAEAVNWSSDPWAFPSRP